MNQGDDWGGSCDMDSRKQIKLQTPIKEGFWVFSESVIFDALENASTVTRIKWERLLGWFFLISWNKDSISGE